MRIGLFGNTNNYPLLLAEALRGFGHDVVLVVDSAERLHRPESRRPQWSSGYPDWILDAGHLSEWDLITLAPPIVPFLDVLAGCDGLILNSLGPSLLPLLSRPAISLLTGSDLTHYASPATVDARSASWSVAFRDSVRGYAHLLALKDLVCRQRRGIATSYAVSYLPPGIDREADDLLSGLGQTGDARFTVLMADLGAVAYSPPSSRRSLRVFCATRLTWKGPVASGRSTLDYKASDLMIEGLGAFQRSGGALEEVRLVRKGLHLEEAERLVVAQGLQEKVRWLDEMTLGEVWDEFASADVVFEQLGPSMVGMAGMDAMAIGRPVIANGRPEAVRRYLGEPFPVCQAASAHEVADWLERLTDPELRREVGAAASSFARTYFDPSRAAGQCLSRLRVACRSEQTTRRANHRTIRQKQVRAVERAVAVRRAVQTIRDLLAQLGSWWRRLNVP